MILSFPSHDADRVRERHLFLLNLWNDALLYLNLPANRTFPHFYTRFGQK